MRARLVIFVCLALSAAGCPSFSPFVPDSGVNDVDAGVTCGASLCPAPNVCCLDTGVPFCSARCSEGLGLHCDGPEDCGPGWSCCLSSHLNDGSTCMRTCSQPSQLCHTTADCGGATCASCRLMIAVTTIGVCTACPEGTTPGP